MKSIITLLVIFIGSGLFTASCTEDMDGNESEQSLKPGIYYVQMGLTTNQEASTKGVEQGLKFDQDYSYDYIYLHQIGATEGTKGLKLPVWECPECEGGKGIRYRICVNENNETTITPISSIDEDGKPVYTEESLTLSSTENVKFYFSSYPTQEWSLDETTQINNENNIAPTVDCTHYYRDRDVNQEIYRSDTDDTDGYAISELQETTNITLERACAGFSVVGLFYDKETYQESYNGNMYITSSEKFEKVMESSPEHWYIKIYVGGKCYPTQYNITTGDITSNDGGYYSSGDANKWDENIDTEEYLPFSSTTYAIGDSYGGYGYYSRVRYRDEESGENVYPEGNFLFSPVAENEDINVYVLIKYYDGEDTPTEEWLHSDEGALMTTVTLPNGNNVENNNFYTVGLTMSIQDLATAWKDNEMGAPLTKNAFGGASVHEFVAKDAKVIFEVH